MAISEFPVTVEQKKYLTSDVLYLSLKVSDHFSFKAGQYVMLKIIKEGVLRWKPYSILNPPSELGKIDLCAKIIPGGFSSEFLQKVQEREALIIRGPLGQFFFEEKEEEHWFICNGVGITPLYSMIADNISKHPQKKFTLLFGVRSKENLFFDKELKRLEKKHPSFSYIPTLSQDTWEGAIGRVQKHLPNDISNKIFYICGLKEMVLETKELLLSKGVSPEKIKMERYS